MSDFAPTSPAPPPAAETPAAPSLGGLRELAFFLLTAILLLFAVQIAAFTGLVFYFQQQNPGVNWSELVPRAQESVQSNALFLVPVQVLYYGLLVGLLYVLMRARGVLRFWTALRVTRLRANGILPALVGGFLLALLVSLASHLVPSPEPLPFDKLFTSRAAALLVVGASLLVAPLVEELIFRGYIYALLERAWGAGAAVLTSGVLFGSIHFFQLWPGYFQMALLCLVGVTFSLARARTGSTTSSMLMHLGYNATISLGYLFSPEFRQLASSLG